MRVDGVTREEAGVVFLDKDGIGLVGGLLDLVEVVAGRGWRLDWTKPPRGLRT